MICLLFHLSINKVHRERTLMAYQCQIKKLIIRLTSNAMQWKKWIYPPCTRDILTMNINNKVRNTVFKY